MKSRNKGESNPRAKLTETEVLSILKLQSQKVKEKDILVQYPQVARSTIAMILANKSWKYLPRPTKPL